MSGTIYSTFVYEADETALKKSIQKFSDTQFLLEYDDEINSLTLTKEKINEHLPKKLAICVTFFYREKKIHSKCSSCVSWDSPCM